MNPAEIDRLVNRERRVDVPTEAARTSGFGDGMRSSHRRDRHRTKNADTTIATTVEDHLAIKRQIVCRRKQAGVSRDSIHSKGSWIMNLSTQPLFPLSSRVRAGVTEITHLAATFFGWRDPRPHRTQRDLNPVSRIPRGTKTFRCANLSSVSPLTRCTTSPKAM